MKIQNSKNGQNWKSENKPIKNIEETKLKKKNSEKF